MTDPQPSCSEIARDCVWGNLSNEPNQCLWIPNHRPFVSVRNPETFDDIIRKITEALQAKQKTIEELTAENERLLLGMAQRYAKEIESLRAEVEKGVWQIGEWKKEEILWNEREKDYQAQLSRLKEILKGRDEALRTVLKRGKNIQHSDQYLNEVLGACREALSKTWEEGEK